MISSIFARYRHLHRPLNRPVNHFGDVNYLSRRNKSDRAAAHDRNPFSHLDAAGRARMVDVTSKPVTTRTAIARAKVVMPVFVVEEVKKQNLKKGDVLTLAQVAGIGGAKRTSDLIPLCHAVPISRADVTLNIIDGKKKKSEKDDDDDVIRNDDDDDVSTSNGGSQEEESEAAGIEILATVTAEAKTGVEMEALTGALVAALTIYDMCKALTKDIVITDACLLQKTGGKEPYVRRTRSER